MIGDISRTGTYRKAILGNEHIAFRNKNVLDLGAGTPNWMGRADDRFGDSEFHVGSSGCETGHSARSIFNGRQNGCGTSSVWFATTCSCSSW
jgi:hypothetical protein